MTDIVKLEDSVRPLLLETLVEGDLICLRLYHDADIFANHFTFKRTEVEESTVTGRILKLTPESSVLGLQVQRVGQTGASTLITNTDFVPLSHESFGGKNYVWMCDHVINTRNLKESSLWQDFRRLAGATYTSAEGISFRPLYDTWASSSVSKADLTSSVALANLDVAFEIGITSKYDDCNDVYVITHVNPRYGYIGSELRDCDAEVLSGPIVTMSISGDAEVRADSYATINVKLNSVLGSANEMDVYIESYSGYLPVRKKETSGGCASFKVYATGLDVGDKILVKAGFKDFSGMCSTTVTVRS